MLAARRRMCDLRIRNAGSPQAGYHRYLRTSGPADRRRTIGRRSSSTASRITCAAGDAQCSAAQQQRRGGGGGAAQRSEVQCSAAAATQDGSV
jgi:hypothetical protein